MNEIEKLKQQLKEQQKMASLGLLSAGIAHEIQNPLNFVINFSKLSEKLLNDIKEIVIDIEDKIDDADAEELQDITSDLILNMQKIKENGERAISIIQGILLISRGKEGEALPTDIPHLIHEYVWLSYHAKRAKDKTFNVTINENFGEDMPLWSVIPQDLSRAVINMMNNAFYAVKARTEQELSAGNSAYKPTVNCSAKVEDGNLVICLADNGTGIDDEVKEKLFHETVTTKPVGEGTGLGMQITHDIITNAHKGQIIVDSTVGEGTTIKFVIPAGL